MKLWSCYNADYIEQKFVQLKQNVSLISVWQLLDNKKESFQGYIKEFDAETCEIGVSDSEVSGYNKLNLNEPIFFHYEKEDIIFKRDVFILNNKTIRFKTPAEVKFREKRSAERFGYKYQDFKSISFRIGESDDIHSFILTDISLSGTSFVVPQEYRDKLNNDSAIYLTGITDQVIAKGLKAKVVEVTPFHIAREADSKLLRIGVQFSEELDSVTYDSLGKIIETKKNKTKGINTNKFNGLNEDDYQRTISRIAIENKQLAANISDAVENLDRLRYLTLDMKRDFLLEVNHDVFAAALRLSSKELIMELLGEITDSMREEFLDKLNIAKPASAINKAQDQICKFIREKENSGEIVLDPRSFTKYV